MRLPTDEELLAELAEYVAIASDSRSASAGDDAGGGGWLAARLAFADGRVEETDGFPVVRGGLAGRARRADGPGLRPLRRAADRRPRGVDDAAVRDRRRRGRGARPRGAPTTRAPSCWCSSSPRRCSTQRGRAAAEREVPVRGRGGDRQPAPAGVRPRARRRARRRPGHLGRRRHVAARPSRRCRSPPRAWSRSTSSSPAADRDLHSGPLRRHRRQPGARAGRRSSPRLHGPDGAVAVDGFYDGVDELPAERRGGDRRGRLRRGGLPRRRSVSPELVGEAGYSTLQRLWERPDAGGQRHHRRRQVHRHPAPRGRPRHLPAGRPAGPRRRGRRDRRARRVADAARGAGHRAGRRGPGARPTGSSRDHPAIRAATAALEEVYPGQDVLLAVIAGTLPATTLFEEVLGAKTLFFSFATADEQHHAPNEFFRIRPLRRGHARPGRSLWDRPRRLDPARLGGRPHDRATGPTTTWPATSACPSSRSRRRPTGCRRTRRASPPSRSSGPSGCSPTTITISLHDHPVLLPGRHGRHPAYNRTGRQHTAFDGLRASGLTVVFDNMMDGTACVTGNAPWQWDDVVTDLGMRLADLAHQSDVGRRSARVDDIHRGARRRPGRAGLRPRGGDARSRTSWTSSTSSTAWASGRSASPTPTPTRSGRGSTRPVDGGLTALGRRAVRRMNQLGLAIDVSHSSDRTGIDGAPRRPTGRSSSPTPARGRCGTSRGSRGTTSCGRSRTPAG